MTRAETLERLLQTRQDVREIFGAEYDAKVGPFRAVIRGIARERGLSLLQAGIALGREMAGQAGGLTSGLVLAATCDEIEAGL